MSDPDKPIKQACLGGEKVKNIIQASVPPRAGVLLWDRNPFSIGGRGMRTPGLQTAIHFVVALPVFSRFVIPANKAGLLGDELPNKSKKPEPDRSQTPILRGICPAQGFFGQPSFKILHGICQNFLTHTLLAFGYIKRTA